MNNTETLEDALYYMRELRAVWDWEIDTIYKIKREVEELDAAIKRMDDIIKRKGY